MESIETIIIGKVYKCNSTSREFIAMAKDILGNVYDATGFMYSAYDLELTIQDGN